MPNESPPVNVTEVILKKLEMYEQLFKHANQIAYSSYQSSVLLKDLILQKQTDEIRREHRNPLNQFGTKCFSQTDEDGITLEIIRRLGIERGFYAEFGVGNGLENNTLILAALGWKGFWVGGEDLAFNHAKSKKFRYFKEWITLDNIVGFAKRGCDAFEKKAIDVISLDLDGNDIHFVRNLLATAFQPKLFIVEYSAKFPPPVKFEIPYDPNHRWTGDDYFGASLASFAEMFMQFGYQLVCCNAHTGANAFFIKKDQIHLFQDVPANINDIYVSPRYHLFSQHGHRPSARVVELIINKDD